MASDAPRIAPFQVNSVETADWTGDGYPDRAVLIETEDGADLLIYIGEARSDDGESAPYRLAARRDGIAWRGRAWGTFPELALSSSGALQVISRNEAIGRHRWQETVTILWRDGRFIVGGYTFEARDTLDPGAGSSCDINLITGGAILDGVRAKLSPAAEPVESWASPGGCPERKG